jgi:hypothetical protein
MAATGFQVRSTKVKCCSKNDHRLDSRARYLAVIWSSVICPSRRACNKKAGRIGGQVGEEYFDLRPHATQQVAACTEF